MQEEIEVPIEIKTLAKQANGNPIAWRFTEDAIVIVFEDGRKLTFEREPASKKPASKNE